MAARRNATVNVVPRPGSPRTHEVELTLSVAAARELKDACGYYSELLINYDEDGTPSLSPAARAHKRRLDDVWWKLDDALRYLRLHHQLTRPN